MKKIKLFFPHIELRVMVSDEMVADLKECERMAEETNCEGGKDCDTCSWRDVEIENTRMCELEEVYKKVLEEE